MKVFAYPETSLHRPNTPFRFAVKVKGRWVGAFAPGAVRARREHALGILSLTDPKVLEALEAALHKRMSTP